MIKELGELNEKFYELYGRLYENGELLTPKQATLMADNLLAQYKAEYELLTLKTGIDEMKELYAVKQRRGAFIPHRWRFLFWGKANQAATTIEREIQAEITQYFNAREKALERLIEALDKENEQTLEENDGENESMESELTNNETPGAAETSEEASNKAETPDGETQSEETMEPGAATDTPNSN